jgi:plasmid stability protein
MATLNIRNLPENVHRSLRLRAAHAGRSMEAEARAILAAACTDEDEDSADAADLQAFVDALYGSGKPEGVVDDLLEERKREAERE